MRRCWILLTNVSTLAALIELANFTCPGRMRQFKIVNVLELTGIGSFGSTRVHLQGRERAGHVRDTLCSRGGDPSLGEGLLVVLKSDS
eukprot:101944-Amphidinium_carterae.2